MQIQNILRRMCIVPALISETKDEVLAELAESIANHYPGLDKNKIYQSLKEREQIGSTGIGDETALPHAKISGVFEILACFARSLKGVRFDGVDSKPIKLFFCFIYPPEINTEYLSQLAQVSKLLSDTAKREQLLSAATEQEIYTILNDIVEKE